MRAEVVFPELTEIEGLRGKIQGWRQSQPKSRSMPEELWQEASTAAKSLGAGRGCASPGAELRDTQAAGPATGRVGLQIACSAKDNPTALASSS